MNKKVLVIIILFCIIALAFIVYFSLPGPPSVGHNDSRIISAINQARSVMSYLASAEGSYDSFSCQNKDMALICEEIHSRGGEAIIALDKQSGSQSACIYSLLPYRSGRNKAEASWYCADSSGGADYTVIDPGGNGYCVDGESAICPSKEPQRGGPKLYKNERYEFQLKYPDKWEVSFFEKNEAGFAWLAFTAPTGNYIFKIFILDNPEELSSREWVSRLLQDSSEKGARDVPGFPIIFQAQKELAIAGLPAYELYGVFAYDQSNEEIYLARGSLLYKFEFPVAEENPNLSEPVENNKIVHEMLNTFRFLK